VNQEYIMKVELIEEAGFHAAMAGMSLSYNQPVEKMPDVALKLHKKDGGHNKFLESMVVWLMVTAPRYWWQQADTYRMSTKQSGSTMHTIMKRPLEMGDFEPDGITVEHLNSLNALIEKNDFFTLKKHLPESILQKREWMVSYKTLRNIILQRLSHKLPHWQSFAKQVIEFVHYPQYLPSISDNN